MTKTWIVFSIGDHRVHKLSDNGCRGEDMIRATRIMVANEYDIDEEDVKISFEDEEVKLKRDTVVSYRVKEIMLKTLKRKDLKN